MSKKSKMSGKEKDLWFRMAVGCAIFSVLEAWNLIIIIVICTMLTVAQTREDIQKRKEILEEDQKERVKDSKRY